MDGWMDGHISGTGVWGSPGFVMNAVFKFKNRTKMWCYVHYIAPVEVEVSEKEEHFFIRNSF